MITQEQYRQMTPLIKVVKAAIVDAWEDLGKTQQRYAHWAARGLEKLTREVQFKQLKRKAMLPVSRNTMTATLPMDWGDELFVGVINNKGRKVPMVAKSDVVYMDDIAEMQPDRCEECGCDKNVCNDLSVHEEVSLIDIGGIAYEESVIKKLYPDGSYYEERATPTLEENGLVVLRKSRSLITKFKIKPCGCLQDSKSNQSKLLQYCPDVYASYYTTPCTEDDCCCTSDWGGYHVHEEIGLISLEPQFPFDYVYVEYTAFMPKINGQYMAPKVAFETLVNYTKFKSVENKKSVTLSERNWHLDNYKRERANMEKVLGRISLSQIVQAALLIPRLVVAYNGGDWYSHFQKNSCMMKKNCDVPQPQVIQSVVRSEQVTNRLVAEKKSWTIDDESPNGLTSDMNSITVTDAGVIEKSVKVLFDQQPVNEGPEADRVSYTTTYGLNGFTLLFNQPFINVQKIVVEYNKQIAV